MAILRPEACALPPLPQLIETERVRLGLPAQAYTGPGAVSTDGTKYPSSGAGGGGAAEGGGRGEAEPEMSSETTAELHRVTCLIAAGFQV